MREQSSAWRRRLKRLDALQSRGAHRPRLREWDPALLLVARHCVEAVRSARPRKTFPPWWVGDTQHTGDETCPAS